MAYLYSTDLRHASDPKGRPRGDLAAAADVIRIFGDYASAALLAAGERVQSLLRCVVPRGSGICRGRVDVQLVSSSNVNWGCRNCGSSGDVFGFEASPYVLHLAVVEAVVRELKAAHEATARDYVLLSIKDYDALLAQCGLAANPAARAFALGARLVDGRARMPITKTMADALYEGRSGPV